VEPPAAEYWHSLLRPDAELTEAFCERLAARMRAERLTFGDRVHCPFLRPFFLDEADERRVRDVAEAIAAMGERLVTNALADPALLAEVALTEPEERLVRIDPGYRTASTASRLDAFLRPASLQFAEYNAESPAGFGYAQRLADIFQSLDVMGRFRERFEVRAYQPMDVILEALVASYREWGGTADPPVIAIVDWRDVPTWSEFEILQAHFAQRGLPTLVCDPRDLEFDGHRLIADGRRIDLLYRRVLVNDIVARAEECRALVAAYEAGAVCMANTFRCKIPHKKAFFAVLTDEANRRLFSAAEQELIARHVPWTRLLRDVRTTRNSTPIELLDHVRAHRSDLVIKPNDEYGGTGVILGWEVDERAWDGAIARGVANDGQAWIVQERISVRLEPFPQFEPGAGVTRRDLLVDLAPYLFRGRLAGFLTRLSASGLANVTSGGGQVPSFVVVPRQAE
jgi:uncharacterized circularly permuted ATP-grasp superfamily protein